MSIPYPSSLISDLAIDLPRRDIPGSYGVPFFGPMKDRWDFFYFQGRDLYFKSRMEKYNSTVLRTNMPPGPCISPDSRVVALLDGKSFPILFDRSKVDKQDVLLGTYTQSTSFNGGHRVCPFLDPSEPNHSLIKGSSMSFLDSKKDDFIPLFQSCAQSLFIELEDQVKNNTGSEKVPFRPLGDTLAFEFIFRLLCDGKSPLDTNLKSDGVKKIKKWLLFQIAPVFTFGLPKRLIPIEDLLLHSLRLPFFLVKNDYNDLCDAFSSSASSYFDKARKYGVSKEEATHNLLFTAGFNAFGGLSVWFPILIKWIASQGETLHRDLANEIRTAVYTEGGITLDSIEKMTLTKSVVYEALRIEPPVPYQYGRAREDLVIESHDAGYEIKKGEMIFGFQTFASRDPKIFDNAEEFVSRRFVGEEGEKMLRYVLWSNGRETDNPTVDNKQCPGKDLVILLSRLLVVEFFLRYDTFGVQVSSSGFPKKVSISSLTKATNVPKSIRDLSLYV